MKVDAVALQKALRNLDLVYLNFFRRVKKGEKPGYPRAKGGRNHYQSYSVFIYLSRVGKSLYVSTRIRIRNNGVCEGKIYSISLKLFI